MKVGIPRTLSYYTYYPMWKTFLEKLGVEVVISDPTSKQILDDGMREAVADACVPIKLYHGHVINLINRVDYIFIPRMVSVGEEDTFCPKFLGLPDMITCSLKNLPNLITTRIDLKKGKLELYKVFYNLGTLFTRNIIQIIKAAKASINSLSEYSRGFIEGGIPPLNLKRDDIKGDITLAVLGYPYMLYDPYLSLDLIKKLLSLGVSVVTPEMLSRTQKERQAPKLRKTLFWHYSNDVMRTVHHYFEYGGIDGIIHVTAFSCGPDFIVDKLIELEARERNIPFLTITFDEHTGEEGLRTRLEAFIDMLRLRRTAV